MSAEALSPQNFEGMTDSSRKKYKITEGKAMPTGFYEGKDMGEVDPNEIEYKRGERVAGFGRSERENAAGLIVDICQQEGAWVGLTVGKLGELEDSLNADTRKLWDEAERKNGHPGGQLEPGTPRTMYSGVLLGLKELAGEKFVTLSGSVEDEDTVVTPTKKFVDHIVQWQKHQKHQKDRMTT